MLATSNMSRITLSKSSFSFKVSSHLVRGSLSFTSSSASIFSLFGFICVREGSFFKLSYMRKSIRRVLPKDESQYQHDWHIKNRKRQPTFESDRECPADRILGNPAMVQL